MKPFILKQHDKDFAALRQLRDNELDLVGGAKPPILGTVTSTPDCDGGYDGDDQ